jgi:cis-3-alkyl-4-acyloxetan-2-one decarboxylase
MFLRTTSTEVRDNNQPDTGITDHVQVDGARLAYREAGPADGEPVVLLHGYPANHRCWRHQIEALAATHRVVAPDLLGWGESDRPLNIRFDCVTEVGRLGRLLDALGMDRCSLFAHDYGGFLSLGFVQANPDRVSRLAILNSRAQGTFVPRWYAIFGLTTLIGRTPGLRSLAARLPLAEMNRRGLAPLIRGGFIDRELLESYVGWMKEPEGRRWLIHFFGDYRVAARPELRRRLGEIVSPTAVIWGRDDAYIRPEIAEELTEGIPDAELTMLDAGHFVMEERPAEVTAALQELLAR